MSYCKRIYHSCVKPYAPDPALTSFRFIPAYAGNTLAGSPWNP